MGIMSENHELENLIAKTFIARTDVKARQISTIAYNPVRTPWKRADISAHLSKEVTYGHYLTNQDDQCKLFCFDIDLKAGEGFLPMVDFESVDDNETWERSFQKQQLRAAWAQRSHPARSFIKNQLKVIAGQFMRHIYADLGLRTAAAYSGSKGLHVYGFTGMVSARDARDGAQIVLDATENWRPYKGISKFEHVDQDPAKGFGIFDVEVYPKQDTLEGKDLGNLLRLPLGRNLKSNDPTFFIDFRSPMSVWKPADPIWALTTDNPWEDD